MEEYGLDELAASADALVPGLGPLAAGLARLAGEAGRAVTLEAKERVVTEQGRELLRGVFQLSLDTQAAAEVRLPQVSGADGVTRTRAEHDHARAVVTTLGEVSVRRIAYRAGVKGVPSLFPRDAVLNLPPCCCSWRLQYLVVMPARDGAYELAREFVQAATGITVGKRQLEEIVAAAAADVAAFYAVAEPDEQQQEEVPGQDVPDGQQPGTPPAPAGRGCEPEEGTALPLGMSADGKGVAMRPESRRRRTRAPGKRVKRFRNRPGTGEKGHKRNAKVACVFDVIPQPRTP